MKLITETHWSETQFRTAPDRPLRRGLHPHPWSGIAHELEAAN